MSIEEARESIEKLRKKNYSDEDIVISFCLMFIDDKISYQALDALVNLMDYSFNEYVTNLTNEEKKVFFKNLCFKEEKDNG